MVEAGLATSEDDVEGYARQIDALHQEPQRRDLAWRLGLDEQVIDEQLRLAEMRNFIEALTRLGREGLLAVDR
ncbi:hypothetical protein MTDSW087_00092 [Methylobacterium dankookense]|uniref:Uncharacterized protein n=1 Tax=Methylobacterium dankookense TaxID=560405 RepID=A0A564FQJ5_9HYPH|nr:hypothetical protein IFDJLNFL_3881 [Methylobacterium dankookense]VUF10425.1 hypothetical protein MTDSW087_00092 [Methylobacterium dankookense]